MLWGGYRVQEGGLSPAFMMVSRRLAIRGSEATCQLSCRMVVSRWVSALLSGAWLSLENHPSS